MRKKSVKKAAQYFVKQTDDILKFLSVAEPALTDKYNSWVYDYAVIRLYREFETLVLDALIGALNNDTATISSQLGFDFPKHITDEVCDFLITGTGYFDFKGRDGLLKTLKSFVPDNHYLYLVIKDSKHKNSLELLSGLRNFAAHESAKSKQAARKATDMKGISSSGSWLKRQGRFVKLANGLKALANEIERQAPF